jgi:uncharacterized membrane protein YfcA
MRGSGEGRQAGEAAVTGPHAVLLVVAGLAAGVSNGVAGGGTLLSFPALLAVGYPAITANVTSTVGLWPSTLGGSAGFRRELTTQGKRVRALVPAACAGGLIGSILLLTTPASAFRSVVPYLILAACALFASQPLIARTLRRVRGETEGDPKTHTPWTAVAGTLVAAVYGGYFGAGLGIILLAVLGTVLHDALHRINGLRTILAMAVNLIALLVFVFAAHVAWSAAGLLAVASGVGGYTGARLSRRLPAWVLRIVVVAFGLAAAIRLLIA